MKEISEIERKVDLLTSGMKLPRKRTRRRVATIATTMLIISAFIVSASLIDFYYVQTGEVNVKSLVTITDPDGVEHDAGWEESVTIGGGGDFFAGDEYISENYTIAYANISNNSAITIYIHIEVTETLINGDPGNGDGLLVEVYNDEPNSITQIDLTPGIPEQFTIHVTADEHINAASTYEYTITMDWIA